ncbi:H-NS family nucleoid-associated regulatory protein [Halorhodospira halochloris]|uniref:H-NS histone family protein n=1 Tax=Halorhodospira halochloris TaxID=1052 RepID=UPI001EE8A17D|nr:H-NS histone family protein [Halorhodospira halochloris]MCG5549188.1 H-NS histone family protein [Halorhodospira halochloris]
MSEALEQFEEALQQLNHDELNQAQRLLEREMKRRSKEARKQAQNEMKQVAEKYGLSLQDIVEAAPQKSGKSKGKVPPKFRHPEDPTKEWTGRGRTPKWVQEWIDQGGDKEDLRI